MLGLIGSITYSAVSYAESKRGVPAASSGPTVKDRESPPAGLPSRGAMSRTG